MRAAALALLVVTGCFDDLLPEVGPPVRAVCADGDSDPGTAIAFATDIFDAILRRTDLGCVDCHSASGSSPIGLETSGLDLTSFDTLMRGGDSGGVVVPGDPCGSLLVQKVSESPPDGARMPLDGPPFLTAGERQRLHDWIAEGAHQ